MLSFYSRILVAYDGSDLGKKSLQMAKELSKQDEKIEVFVLHVMNTQNLSSEFGVYEALNEKQEKDLTQTLNDAKEIMTDSTNPIEYVVLKGQPAEMLIEYAKHKDIDLIIIGSRGLSPFKQVVLGSVSHNVVQHAHCPVLIAK